MKRVHQLLAVLLLVLLLLASIFGCAQSGKPPAPTLSTTSITTLMPALSPPQAPATVPDKITTPILTPTINPITTPSLTQTSANIASPKPTLTSTNFIWTKPGTPVTLTVDNTANRATYSVNGTQVSGYFFKPQGIGPFPAVMVLHGRAGLQEAQRLYAVWAASQGYIAFAPDYFAPINMPGATWAGTDYAKYTDQIKDVLGQGLEALKSLSYVDLNHLEVVGFSLGGYYAVVLATRDDVKSAVSYYGAYAGTPIDQTPCAYSTEDIISQLKAPLLMFHGDKDELVPIARADTMNKLLNDAGKSCEYVVYKGAGHAFGEPYLTMSKEKVLEFFKLKQ